jgi:Calcineurin-like phosphoesterase
VNIKLLLLSISLSLIVGCASRPTGPDVFSFGVIGDMQYNAVEESQFLKLTDTMNAEKLTFVVHLGDFKAGSNAPCSDELFKRRLSELNRFQAALIFTPGDNDWVDCRRPTNGATNPIARLSKIREIFYPTNFSLGQQPLPLTRQSDAFVGEPVLSRYRENVFWLHKGIVFVTLNVQGSNDNVGFDRESDNEQAERLRANLAWLDFAISRARGTDIIGLAVMIHANPGFEATTAEVAKSAYVPFLQAVEKNITNLNKPTLFIHGDTHTYRVDKPYKSPIDKRVVANMTRVETDGSPRMDWTRITVDTRNKAAPFYIQRGQFNPTITPN